MNIRTARPDDLPGIQQYDRHIREDRLHDCIARGQVDVLTEGDQILGVLRWSLFWQSIPFLDLIYLDGTVQGRGWGRKMMAHWETAMAAQGFGHVLLSTQEDETSQFFYDRLGYRRIGAFLPPEQDARELMFGKELMK